MPQSAQEWWERRELAPLGVERERAVTDVLDVPRMQVMRWGDGQEHLHWWVMGRETGAEQLRGSFLANWDEVLPAPPRTDSRVDLDAVAQRLIDLAGGEIPG